MLDRLDGLNGKWAQWPISIMVNKSESERLRDFYVRVTN